MRFRPPAPPPKTEQKIHARPCTGHTALPHPAQTAHTPHGRAAVGHPARRFPFPLSVPIGIDSTRSSRKQPAQRRDVCRADLNVSGNSARRRSNTHTGRYTASEAGPARYRNTRMDGKHMMQENRKAEPFHPYAVTRTGFHPGRKIRNRHNNAQQHTPGQTRRGSRSTGTTQPARQCTRTQQAKRHKGQTG